MNRSILIEWNFTQKQEDPPAHTYYTTQKDPHRHHAD